MENTKTIAKIINKQLPKDKKIQAYDRNGKEKELIDMIMPGDEAGDDFFVFLERISIYDRYIEDLKQTSKNFLSVDLDLLKNFDSVNEYIKYLTKIKDRFGLFQRLNFNRLYAEANNGIDFIINNPKFKNNKTSIDIEGSFNGYIEAKNDIRCNDKYISDLRIMFNNSIITAYDNNEHRNIEGNISKLVLQESPYVVLHTKDMDIKVDIGTRSLDINGYKRKTRSIYKNNKIN